MDYPTPDLNTLRGQRLRLGFRRRSAAFSEKRSRQAPLSRSLRCGDQRSIDDVALRVAAADPRRVVADRLDRFDGPPIIPTRESEHAIDEAAANFGRHLPVLARPHALVLVERLPQAHGVIG